jgi:hypothetical protein
MNGHSERTGRPTAVEPYGTPQRGDATGTLAARQAELVASLVAGAAPPPGFDADRIAATRQALLRKRAGEVARTWPMLRAALGDRWLGTFTTWAAGRPPQGSLRDGWDLARGLAAAGSLPALAAQELAARESGWAYDGETPPHPRRRTRLRASIMRLVPRSRRP